MENKQPETRDRIAERLAMMAEQPEKPYFLRYRIEPGRFGLDDATEEDGLTQDVVLISCITQPDGAYSQTWLAVNGATSEPLDDRDVFKAWIMMAASLREKEGLPLGVRGFVDDVFEAWREGMPRVA